MLSGGKAKRFDNPGWYLETALQNASVELRTDVVNYFGQFKPGSLIF